MPTSSPSHLATEFRRAVSVASTAAQAPIPPTLAAEEIPQAS